MALRRFTLSRRSWLVGAPAFISALGACAHGLSRTSRSASPYVEIERTAARQGACIVALLPDTAQTREVWRALCDELSPDYQLIAVQTRSSADRPIIEEAVRRHQPSALVLMNNTTLAAYGDYQRAHGGRALVPAVVVMSAFFDGRGQTLAHTTGISYEVPLITVVTNLRKLIATPIERVGVVHRKLLAGFVEREAKLAAVEQIGVVHEEVSNEPNASELKRALRHLKQRVDALWVLNDDRLLTPRLIVDGWLPGLNERPWLPTIVGAASLVAPDSSFGTFAMLPDHAALGVQVADLLFEIAQNGWKLPEDAHIQLPLSTTTTIDLGYAEKHFALREEALAQVDRILK